jgi:hypothetical protein
MDGLVVADRTATQGLLRRQVRDWRDHWTLEAQIAVRRAVAARMGTLAEAIRALPVKELALVRTGFGALPEVAAILQAASDAAGQVVEQARAALGAIVTDHLAMQVRAADGTAPAGLDTRDLLALGQAAVPFAAAVGLGLALPGMAVTTSTAMFGLVATSAVSLPVLAAGIGGIVALSAFGAINLPTLRTGQEAKLLAAIEAELEKRLFAPAAQGRPPSLLAQVEAGFAEAAARLGRPD